MSAVRKRLDETLVARGLAATRSAARGLVMAGLVKVDGKISDKAGTPVTADARISVKERPRYVSRGGDKLSGALREFQIDPGGMTALDVGASTGGFVDCLLQAGAAAVIALDVGYGQLDMRLRQDPRVTVIEKTNARYLSAESLPYRPLLLTMDVSFISVTKTLPAVVSCMADIFSGVVLIKPQFEAGPQEVGKGGVIRDVEVHRRVLLDTGRFVIQSLDCDLLGICRSDLPGADGNVEYFFHIGRGGEKGVGLDSLDSVVSASTRSGHIDPEERDG